MHRLCIIVFVAALVVCGECKRNITRHPKPRFPSLHASQHRATEVEGDPAAWLISLNCALSKEQVATVANELYMLLNGCYLETTGLMEHTSHLRVHCMYAIDNTTLFTGTLLETVRELLFGQANVTSACTTGPKFGIIEEKRVSTGWLKPKGVQAASVTTQTGSPWHLDRIDQRTGYDDGFHYAWDGSNIVVYVIDSGVRISHHEFGGRASQWLDLVDPPSAGDPNGMTISFSLFY